MIWGHLLLVIILAFIFSAILVGIFRWRHPASSSDAVGGAFIFLFMILLFSIWAAGVWLPPWGPVIMGTPWVVPVLIALFFSLFILSLAAPARRPRTRLEKVEQAREEEAAGTIFGVFFWILIAALLISALVSYF